MSGGRRWPLARVLSLAATLWLAAGAALAIEEPEYRVVEKLDGFELREYPPLWVATVTVEGDRAAAGNRGFRPLLRYISGDNVKRDRIAMTAPVIQQPGADDGESIAMTAPVLQQGSGDAWQLMFVMPAGRSGEDLPQPEDPAVSIQVLPARLVAALRYSGGWGEARYQRFETELRAAVAQAGLSVCGPAQWARYDPPFMPWFLRRNEVLLPVARGGCD
ncbi:MAG: heme-binding protein [Pseudomonadales bacterium]